MGKSFLRALLFTVLASTASSGIQPVILVSLDGMGWQTIERKLANTPNLDYIAETGVKSKRIRTVTPTLTWPNHQTYITGLYSESHGIVSNAFYDPLYNEMFIYEKDCSNNDPKFYNQSEPIWLTLQRQGGRSGVYFWPGSGGYEDDPTFSEKPICKVNCKDTNIAELTTNASYWPHCMFNYSEPWHLRIDKIMGWLGSREPPEFIAMYVEEPDSKGHYFGAFSPEYLKEIERVDKYVVGYLLNSLKKLNILDEVNLIFVTDHGFANVTETRQIYLNYYVDPSLYFLTNVGTAAHIWPYKGKLEEVYQSLKRINHPHIKVYKREDIPDVLHWKNNRRIPPIFIDPDLGWQVMTSAPRDSTNTPLTYGAHGWPSIHLEMGSMFLARGPAFQEGVEFDGFEAVDIYVLMCRLLGLNPLPNNGSIGRVKGMLLKPSAHNSQLATSRAGQSIFWLFVLLILLEVYG